MQFNSRSNSLVLNLRRRDQLKGMADRIQNSRKFLYEKLKALGTPGDWQHILKQNGMFTFTGLNRKPPLSQLKLIDYALACTRFRGGGASWFLIGLSYVLTDS